MTAKEIQEAISLDDIVYILNKLGATTYEDRGDHLIFPTICHNQNEDGASLKLYYYNKNKMFHCYTNCSETFSIFNLVEKVWTLRGYSDDEKNWRNIFHFVVGCLDTEKFFELSTNKEKYRSISSKFRKKEKVELEIFNPGLLEIFTNYYPIEWLNDGISKKAMDRFKIKYSIRKNKVIIPHWDMRGNLVGIRGRALDPDEAIKGKYMPVKIEGKWYSHPLSLNLYGLFENKENIKNKKVVYLFEGEKSVLQCETFLESGENCAVATCGSQFNKNQLLLLLELKPKEIIICFDNEEEEGSTKYFYKLWKICEKYNHYCEMSFIYDRESLLDKKDSPSDKGKEIFKQLLNRRIRVK